MDEYREAKSAYKQARSELENVMDIWDREHEQMDSAHHFLERASDMVSTKSHGLTKQIVDKTLRDWRLGNIQVEDADSTDRNVGEAFSKGVSNIYFLKVPNI